MGVPVFTEHKPVQTGPLQFASNAALPVGQSPLYEIPPSASEGQCQAIFP